MEEQKEEHWCLCSKKMKASSSVILDLSTERDPAANFMENTHGRAISVARGEIKPGWRQSCAPHASPVTLCVAETAPCALPPPPPCFKSFKSTFISWKPTNIRWN